MRKVGSAREFSSEKHPSLVGSAGVVLAAHCAYGDVSQGPPPGIPEPRSAVLQGQILDSTKEILYIYIYTAMEACPVLRRAVQRSSAFRGFGKMGF